MDLLTLLYQGRNKEILEKGTRPRTAADAVAVIGALSFLGRTEEADLLFKHFSEKLSESEITEARFYLSLAPARALDFEKAKGYLAPGLKSARSGKTGFFVHQGLAIYHFYKKDWAKTLAWAKYALSCALADDFEFGRILALDLVGQTHISCGEIPLGLRSLEDARRLAEKTGHTGLFETLDRSLAIFRCRYGYDGGFDHLRQLAALPFEDNSFTKSNLLLELAHALSLRGRFAEARKALGSAAVLIHANPNARHANLLNAGYAQLKSDFSAKSTSGRQKDIIGDLIKDLEMKDPEAISEAVRSGYLGLLQQAFKLPRNEDLIVFGVLPGTVTFFSGDRIAHRELGRFKTFHPLLAALPATKKELVESLWGYRYDSLRHDSLIYAAVQNCRRLLGPFARWIEKTEAGYTCRARVIELATTVPKPLQPHVFGSSSALNHRQLQVLGELQKKQYIDIQSCKHLFGVSDITAFRDLDGLRKLGYLDRVGRARATKYRLNVEGVSNV